MRVHPAVLPAVIRPLYFHYTDHIASYDSVVRYLPTAEHIDTGQSSYAYWDELEKRWTGEADILVVEQHIVVHEQVLPQLEACPNDWCAFPVDNGFFLHLSCTRFSARLQRAVTAADIRSRARRKCPHCGAPHHAFIDGPVVESLRAHGRWMDPCVHQPNVIHLPE
jgi:hypothetical protein